jgi:hypothetical protein
MLPAYGYFIVNYHRIKMVNVGIRRNKTVTNSVSMNEESYK